METVDELPVKIKTICRSLMSLAKTVNLSSLISLKVKMESCRMLGSQDITGTSDRDLGFKPILN